MAVSWDVLEDWGFDDLRKELAKAAGIEVDDIKIEDYDEDMKEISFTITIIHDYGFAGWIFSRQLEYASEIVRKIADWWGYCDVRVYYVDDYRIRLVLHKSKE